MRRRIQGGVYLIQIMLEEVVDHIRGKEEVGESCSP